MVKAKSVLQMMWQGAFLTKSCDWFDEGAIMFIVTIHLDVLVYVWKFRLAFR